MVAPSKGVVHSILPICDRDFILTVVHEIHHWNMVAHIFRELGVQQIATIHAGTLEVDIQEFSHIFRRHTRGWAIVKHDALSLGQQIRVHGIVVWNRNIVSFLINQGQHIIPVRE